MPYPSPLSSPASPTLGWETQRHPWCLRCPGGDRRKAELLGVPACLSVPRSWNPATREGLCSFSPIHYPGGLQPCTCRKEKQGGLEGAGSARTAPSSLRSRRNFLWAPSSEKKRTQMEFSSTDQTTSGPCDGGRNERASAGQPPPEPGATSHKHCSAASGLTMRPPGCRIPGKGLRAHLLSLRSKESPKRSCVRSSVLSVAMQRGGGTCKR